MVCAADVRQTLPSPHCIVQPSLQMPPKKLAKWAAKFLKKPPDKEMERQQRAARANRRQDAEEGSKGCEARPKGRHSFGKKHPIFCGMDDFL